MTILFLVGFTIGLVGGINNQPEEKTPNPEMQIERYKDIEK